MDTAARKWKDYKANLKDKYFDETSIDEQLKERLKNKINDDDINELINFWRSPECQVSNSSISLFHPLAYECANHRFLP
jgi:hypothetical protein